MADAWRGISFHHERERNQNGYSLFKIFRNRLEKYCSIEGSHTKSYRFRISIPSTTENCSSSVVKKLSVNTTTLTINMFSQG